MATILQAVPEDTLPFPDDADDLPPHLSAFQMILALVCRRVDELRSRRQEMERRGQPRKKVALRAECAGGWGASPCLISDFSEGGLAFICGHPHGLGDQVRVSWQDPQGSRVEIECTVRHVTAASIGAEFQNVSAEQRWRLVASLTSLSGGVEDGTTGAAA